MDELKAQAIFREQLKKYVEFNEAEWIVFAPYLSFVTLKKKKNFIEPGIVCKDVGFIVKGSVRYFHVKDGEEITGYFSFENEYVSSYKSFLTQTPSVHYIQALEDTDLITITQKNMQAMLANPMLGYKMERFGRLLAEHYLICYEDRVSSFITKTPEERYIDLLSISSGREILQRMPQHYIAHFLGITPVSLSRIRRRIMVESK
ncbi:Crp/Fnr family transcriptional regulator [Mucilaginibacter flavidus]|uniref:Crp/Fnr family transcriptional regulator n=1 Tax=Mucilaginibacter flavidus TaxID=2949309 RepID=UPI00209312B8|nr:Crp/Fnr family transcriptional regulator [Mucilaginibacter flavidus]MCO5945663.1 Crp/Fnr family transcriptional regulator [Mucilaginibacter flavidus]